MTRERFNQLAPAIQKRVRMEMAIAQRVVRDALAQGWTVTVDYGEEDKPVEDSVNLPVIVAALMECDEEWLIMRRGEGLRRERGWVRLVYGNDGWDVVNDHSTNLDGVMDSAMKLAERLEARAH